MPMPMPVPVWETASLEPERECGCIDLSSLLKLPFPTPEAPLLPLPSLRTDCTDWGKEERIDMDMAGCTRC